MTDLQIFGIPFERVSKGLEGRQLLPPEYIAQIGPYQVSLSKSESGVAIDWTLHMSDMRLTSGFELSFPEAIQAARKALVLWDGGPE